MTDDTTTPAVAGIFAADLAGVLADTLEQAKLKARIDARRARIDEAARATWQATGAAPQWKLPGAGAVRLDNVAGEPTPAVTGPAEYASWVAERHPSEVVATITVPADRLADALEALEFAGVDVETSDATVRPAFQSKHLSTLSLDREPEPDEHGHRGWYAVTEDGEVVPGIVGLTPEPRLVVTVDRDVKRAALAEVAAEVAAAAEDAGDVAEPGTEDAS